MHIYFPVDLPTEGKTIKEVIAKYMYTVTPGQKVIVPYAAINSLELLTITEHSAALKTLFANLNINI